MSDLAKLDVRFSRGPGGVVLHQHDVDWKEVRFYRVVEIREGAGRYEWPEGALEICVGDFFLLRPGRRRIQVRQPLRQTFLPFIVASDGGGVLPQLPRILRFQGGPTDKLVLATAFQDARRQLAESLDSEQSRLQLKVMLSIFLDDCNRRASDQARVPPALHEVAVRLATHPEERLTVPRMARIVGLSCSQFTRVFRKVYGTSPARFAIAARIDAACHLMETEGVSVKGAAYSLGYPSPYGFSRQFKNLRGYPPSEHAERSLVT